MKLISVKKVSLPWMEPLDLCDKNSIVPPSSKRLPIAGASKHNLLKDNATKPRTDIRQSGYLPNGVQLIL